MINLSANCSYKTVTVSEDRLYKHNMKYLDFKLDFVNWYGHSDMICILWIAWWNEFYCHVDPPKMCVWKGFFLAWKLEPFVITTRKEVRISSSAVFSFSVFRAYRQVRWIEWTENNREVNTVKRPPAAGSPKEHGVTWRVRSAKERTVIAFLFSAAVTVLQRVIFNLLPDHGVPQ